ncbi:FAD-binding domain-containing protein [Ascobolus immersus RN42]|uniref:FAD-binding domain-containing protein n=1 Tax=Ascobolus immersus RN42 TaxID=1160509 RepID=A0A3N4IIN1_ASCIM|nr:FAD-binding domain-containing protein [Ascobolus immersus RN42]
MITSTHFKCFLFLLLQATSIHSSPVIQAEHDFKVLLKDLSPSARSSVVYPTDAKWANATERWTSIALPDLSMVITPTGVKDVERIVKYAHKHSFPIHTKTSGHGFVVSLRSIKKGIQLNLRPAFDFIKRIDKNTVEIGGGTKNEDITYWLYKNKVRTMTGSCGCVGWMGLALGGGIGKYSGQFGLVTDVLREVNIVTPSAGKQVASAKRNPDLYWALKGAGHNFGVVTSALVDLEPLNSDKSSPVADSNDYSLYEYFFPVSRIEEIVSWFEAWRLKDEHKQAIVYLNVYNANDKNAPVGAQNITQPTINLSMQYWGFREDVLEPPFDALKPLYVMRKKVPWPEVSKALGMDTASVPCLPNGMHIHRSHYPTQISRLDAASIRKSYEWMAKKGWPWQNETNDRKAALAWKVFSKGKISSIGVDDTAIPWRDRSITTLASLAYAAGDPVLAQKAKLLGEEIRAIMNVEKDLTVYINYAYGDEGEVASYGSGARLSRLKGLKKKYDPKQIFSGFMPIKI